MLSVENTSAELSPSQVTFSILTQLTTGGSREADMATPIKGPAEPWSKATATPVPDVRAHKTPIQRARTLPLQTNQRGERVKLLKNQL